MQFHTLTAKEWAKTVGIGFAVAVLTAVIMLAGIKSGISPLPKPLGLAFAQTLLGAGMPLPVGFLFHFAWVTFWSAVYIVLFRDALTFIRALGLAAALWVLALILFFPVVGWGFLGLAVTPRLIVAAAVAHLLFAIFLWGFCRWAFAEPSRTETRAVST